MVICYGVTFLQLITKLINLQKLQARAMTLIQSVPIKGRIPTAKLSVNGLIKLDQVMMVHKILNEQCPQTLKVPLNVLGFLQKSIEIIFLSQKQKNFFFRTSGYFYMIFQSCIFGPIWGVKDAEKQSKRRHGHESFSRHIGKAKRKHKHRNACRKLTLE